MDTLSKQNFICACAAASKIRWSSHALQELIPEYLSVPQVETALCNAQVIEDYPHAHRYLPDCLGLAFVDVEPIHAVIALNESNNYILIVTVYHPNEQEWENDWQTRK